MNEFLVLTRKKKTNGIFVEQKYGDKTTTLRNKALKERKLLKDDGKIIPGFVSYPAKLFVKYDHDQDYKLHKEFTYEDISGNTLDKWKYTFLKEDQLNGKDAWVVERVPNYKGSGYSKTKTWFLKEDNLGYRTEFFDRKGSLLKIQTISSYTKVGNAYRWDEIRMENVQTKKKSVLRVSERKSGQGLREKDFNKRSLKRTIKF